MARTEVKNKLANLAAQFSLLFVQIFPRHVVFGDLTGTDFFPLAL